MSVKSNLLILIIAVAWTAIPTEAQQLRSSRSNVFADDATRDFRPTAARKRNRKEKVEYEEYYPIPKKMLKRDQLLRTAKKYRAKNKVIDEMLNEVISLDGVYGLRNKAFRRELSREVRKVQKKRRNVRLRRARNRSRDQELFLDYSAEYRKKLQASRLRRKRPSYMVMGGAGISQTFGLSESSGSSGSNQLMARGSGGPAASGGGVPDMPDMNSRQSLPREGGVPFEMPDFSSMGPGGKSAGTSLSANVMMMGRKFRLMANVSHTMPSQVDQQTPAFPAQAQAAAGQNFPPVSGGSSGGGGPLCTHPQTGQQMELPAGMTCPFSKSAVANLSSSQAPNASAMASSAELISDLQEAMNGSRTMFMMMASYRTTEKISLGLNLMHMNLEGLDEVLQKIEEDEMLSSKVGGMPSDQFGTTVTPNANYKFTKVTTGSVQVPFNLQSGEAQDLSSKLSTTTSQKGVYQMPMSASVSFGTSSRSREVGKMATLGFSVSPKTANRRFNLGVSGSFNYSIYDSTADVDSQNEQESAMAPPAGMEALMGGGELPGFSFQPESTRLTGSGFVKYRPSSKFSFKSEYKITVINYVDDSARLSAEFTAGKVSYALGSGMNKFLLEGSFTLVSDPAQTFEEELPMTTEPMISVGLRYNFGPPF